jgi:uncharacterized protein YdgA (DUF945 family)
MQPRLKKTMLTFIVALVFAMLLMPIIIGIWIKYEYDALIAFYNSQGNVHIDITKYQRGWFSASVILNVSMSHPWISKLSQRLNEENIVFPDTLHFVVDQHIQYGPILYQNGNKVVAVELAYMYSAIRFSPDLAKVIQPINIYQPTILIVDNLSFSGKFQRSFRSAGLRMIFPNSNNKLEIRNINADVAVWPRQRSIKADIKTGDFILITKDLDIVMPSLEVLCDRQQSAHRIWIGTSSFVLPKIYLQGADKSSLSLFDINSSGGLTESGPMLSGTRDFSIAKIQSGNQLIGPINLRISIHDFDAAMAARLISTYGTMIFSDQNMMAAAQLLIAIPALVNSQSSILIEEFKATTPNGSMVFNGGVTWSGLAATGSRTLSDTIKQTHAQGKLQMAIPLARSIIGVIADINSDAASGPLPVVPRADQKTLIPAQRQNELYIAVLKENHQITDPAATKLLLLQHAHVSMDIYQGALNNLVETKDITDTIAEALKLKYANTQSTAMAPAERRANEERLIENQIEQWVKDGLIIHEKDDYITSIMYQDGNISVNGQEIARVY